MFRRPFFWVAFVVLAAVSLGFGVRYFSHAFPIVSLEITMDRASALARSRDLASRYGFGPSGYEQAASFRGDQPVQNFVELEAGGTSAFRDMFVSGRYQPFRWYVRHFCEGQALETRIYFTPRGEPYGFSVKLPEKEAGAALETGQAQAIAERSAGDWNVALARYTLVETSRDVRPGGRVDHTFVYERPDVRIGEGRYRLRLVVGGDRLTTLEHFVKVPEAFQRRFEEMRSANSAVSLISVVGLMAVYLPGCCGVGLFLLGRQRWILWRAPIAWGVFVAFLQLLAAWNQWRLTWLDYDTALSSGGFIAQQVGLQLLIFVGNAFLFSISFMAAESLTRRAFPRHLQLWRLWSRGVAASKTMLGWTVAGYTLVAVFFGYEVLLYFVATRGLGWWMPSDTLVQPDVLAAYLPWFSAIAISTQAGFWEEAMFRAVPLASAALLGQRYGRRAWWIAGAMLLQAVVFGAGHAGYANQPSYARLAELVVPSFMFGGLYLAFGLWPAVVLHFAYDVVWFALPLFVSSAPGAWVDRLMVMLLVLVPLWVVIGARRRTGAWTEVSDADRNGAWQPPPKVETVIPERAQATAIHPLVVRGLPIAGVAGLALWVAFTVFTPDSPPLDLSRAHAEQRARQALAERGVTLDQRWRTLPRVDGGPAEPDTFVWRTAGRDAYGRLLGEYLAAPRFAVRFARFTGDVAERAEEYLVIVGTGGRVRVRHQLAEDAAMASVAEADARQMAHQTLRDRYGLDPGALKEVAAIPSTLKNRTDWVFRFSVPVQPPLPTGEARAAVEIAGNQVADAYRFVHVPEEWARQERDRRAIPGVISLACIAILALSAVAGVVMAVVSWIRRRFSVMTLLVVAPLLFVGNVLARLNELPSVVAAFSTAQPYDLQLLIAGVGLLIGLALLSLSVGLLGGYVTRTAGDVRPDPAVRWLLGVSVGGLAAGLGASLSRLSPAMSPAWADYSALAAYVPWAAPPLGAVPQYLMVTVVSWFLMGVVTGVTAGWTRRKAAGAAIIMLLGLALVGMRGIDTLSQWAVGGVMTGAFGLGAYVFVLRAAPGVLPIVVATLMALASIKAAMSGAYPGVMAPSFVRVVVLCACGWLVIRLADRRAGSKADPAGAPAQDVPS